MAEANHIKLDEMIEITGMERGKWQYFSESLSTILLGLDINK